MAGPGSTASADLLPNFEWSELPVFLARCVGHIAKRVVGAREHELAQVDVAYILVGADHEHVLVV